MPPDVDKLTQELGKAQKEVQEAAVERERFQSQLEMLVQELEQKQVRKKERKKERGRTALREQKKRR